MLELRDAVLAIQGPPGTGKTYSGGEMICDLVAAGKSVGVTAHSHAVITNLLRAVRKEAARPERRGMKVPIAHIDRDGDEEFCDEAPVVVGGTVWFWTSDNASPVDVLFVDEAGQMSLANTLACTVSAGALVLLGDPQQLEQPTKGVHPDGVGGSALQHFLAGHKTMPAERGEFLEVTRRLAPSICDFTSECFYEDRLEWLPGLEKQVLRGGRRFTGAGLRIVPVEHDGNRNASDEEVAEVQRIVDDLLAPDSKWVNEEGKAKQLKAKDVLIVSPYNAQVGRLQDALGEGARVGTVDKFQGQEAPVVIYSMATSRPEDAPRGLGFLYSLNRFNVATSRARCLCILVASPRLFEPDCQSPAQMQLANALCRYREMATNP
ncbi:MAG: AAA family ATPase [Acidobacteria bacterium]|nr:AAA family ATPase [Acidobacteriota bacterium]